MRTREEQIAFIQKNGVPIAACAHHGHKAHGRGLVAVNCDDHDEVAGTVPFTFLPEALVAKVVEPYYGTKEAQMVAGYEPSTEVVVCFIGAGKGRRMDCYRFRSTPSPEQTTEIE